MVFDRAFVTPISGPFPTTLNQAQPILPQRRQANMDTIPEEYERGKQRSAHDISSGSPRLYGQYPGSWGKLFVQLMAERFSVTVEHTSDITSYAEKSYRAGYNSITQTHIDSVYGMGSYQRVVDEVKEFRNRNGLVEQLLHIDMTAASCRNSLWNQRACIYNLL